MTSFVGFFRGPSVQQARLLALSSDKEIVELFARQLLDEETEDPPAMPGGPDLHLVHEENGSHKRRPTETA